MFLNLHALLKLSHSYISSIEEMVTVLSHYIYCTIHSEWHNIDNTEFQIQQAPIIIGAFESNYIFFIHSHSIFRNLHLHVRIDLSHREYIRPYFYTNILFKIMNRHLRINTC